MELSMVCYLFHIISTKYDLNLRSHIDSFVMILAVMISKLVITYYIEL